MTRAAMVVLMLMAGCGKSAKKAGPPADCEGVRAALDQFWLEKARAAEDPQERAFATDMANTGGFRLQDHCTKDGWSAASADCMKTAATTGDFKACEATFTKAQMDRMNATVKTQ